jgi:hypothetical protein
MDRGMEVRSESASVQGAPKAAAGEAAAAVPLPSAPLPARAQDLPSERPVFFAEDGRRAQVLRVVVRSAAAVTGVWLIALLAGAFGFGRLPAVPLPPIGALDKQGPTARDRATSENGDGEDAVASPTPGSDITRTGLGGTAVDLQVPRARRNPAGRRTPATGSPGSRLVPRRGQAPSIVAPVTGSPSTPATTGSRGHSRSLTPSGRAVPAGTTDTHSTGKQPWTPPSRGNGPLR